MTTGCSGAPVLPTLQDLERAGEQAWRLHDQPDAGMWELRTRASVHTSSSLMCWAACDRLAKIARYSHWKPAPLWTANAAEPSGRPSCATPGTRERQSFTESFGGETLDASLLLMGEVGFLPGDDPRFRSTVLALERSLCDGPHMRRYETGGRLRHGRRWPSTPARSGASMRWRASVSASARAPTSRPAGLPQPGRPAVGGSSNPRTASCGATSRRPIRWWASSNCAVRLSAPWDHAGLAAQRCPAGCWRRAHWS
jgi:hypothetical protein